MKLDGKHNNLKWRKTIMAIDVSHSYRLQGYNKAITLLSFELLLTLYQSE